MASTFGDMSRNELKFNQKSLMEIASSWKGTPYEYGSKGPDTIDCSGFICAVFSKLFKESLMANIQSLRMHSMFSNVNSYRFGDLILWSTHGGIVWDETNFIAANSKNGVEVKPFKSGYWANHDKKNLMFRRHIILDPVKLHNIPA